MENKELDYLSLSGDNLSRVINWAIAADRKAAYVLTFVIFSLGYLFTQTDQGIKIFFWVIKNSQPSNIVTVFTFFIVILFILSTVFLLVSGVKILLALRPRVVPHSAKKSLFFFGTISTMPCDEFMDNFNRLQKEDALKAISDQTFNNSKVVSEKYKNISDSIWWLQLGVLFLILFSLLSQIISEMISQNILT